MSEASEKRYVLCGDCAAYMTLLGASKPEGATLNLGDKCEGPHVADGSTCPPATNVVEATPALLGLARERGFAIGMQPSPPFDGREAEHLPTLEEVERPPAQRKDWPVPKAWDDVGRQLFVEQTAASLMAAAVAHDGPAALDPVIAEQCVAIARRLEQKTRE